MQIYRNFINNQFVEINTSALLAVYSPATEELIGHVSSASH
jgi:hypothetical protein